MTNPDIEHCYNNDATVNQLIRAGRDPSGIVSADVAARIIRVLCEQKKQLHDRIITLASIVPRRYLTVDQKIFTWYPPAVAIPIESTPNDAQWPNVLRRAADALAGKQDILDADIQALAAIEALLQPSPEPPPSTTVKPAEF